MGEEIKNMSIKDYTGGYNINLDSVWQIFDYLNKNKNLLFIKPKDLSKTLPIPETQISRCLGYLCRLGYIDYRSTSMNKKTYTVNRNKNGEVFKERRD